MSRAGSSSPPTAHDQLQTNRNGPTFALTPPAVPIVTASGSWPVKLSGPPTTRKSFDWVAVAGGSPTDMIWRESDGIWYLAPVMRPVPVTPWKLLCSVSSSAPVPSTNWPIRTCTSPVNAISSPVQGLGNVPTSGNVVWRISAEAGRAPTIATKVARMTHAATVLIEFPPHEVQDETL